MDASLKDRLIAAGMSGRTMLPPDGLIEAAQLAEELYAIFAAHGVDATAVDMITSVPTTAVEAIKHRTTAATRLSGIVAHYPGYLLWPNVAGQRHPG